MAESPREGEHLRIRTYPDEVLRRVAEPVGRERFDDELACLAKSMTRTMYEGAGVGLAAPQVGVGLRLVVIDATSERDSPLVLVNPVVVESSGREAGEEGCLSLPEIEATVRRRSRVTIEHETLSGEKAGFEAEELLARVVQHEIDHLDGVLFVDRLGPAGRIKVRKALKELEELAQEA